MADKIISAANLATGGAYTSIGTYDHRELIDLVDRLGNETGTPASDIRLAREELPSQDGAHTRFTLTRQADGGRH